MKDTSKPIEIRDQRSRHMFRVDDHYIDGGYSELCGSVASCVYMSLCRHSDSNQESFPSLERIMKQHGIKSKHTVLKAIRILEKQGIIAVTRKKDSKTKRQMVNVYVLIDKSQWKGPGVTTETGSSEYPAFSSGSTENPGVTRELGVDEPGANNALGAGCIKNTDPGANNAQKPGAPNALEGNTKRRLHIEGSAAQSAPAIPCNKEGCKEKPMKGVEFCEQHQPMSCAQFVAWYRKSEQRHIKIIAEWADELSQNKMAPDLRTVAQWRAWAKPIMTAAKDISVFDDDQIGTAMKRMMSADYVTDFNLHTLKTFLINTKK